MVRMLGMSESIGEDAGVHPGTIFAALAGTRVPSRHTLLAIVKAWGGDPKEWLARRSALENALGTARQVREQEEQILPPQKKPVTWGEIERVGVTSDQLSGESQSSTGPSRAEVVEFVRNLRFALEDGAEGQYVDQRGGVCKRRIQIDRFSCASCARGLYESPPLPSLRLVEALVDALTDDIAQVDAWKDRWLRLRNS